MTDATATLVRPDPAIRPDALFQRLGDLDAARPDHVWDTALDAATELARRAFDAGDLKAQAQVHRILYVLYANEVLPPWSPFWVDRRDVRFAKLKAILEGAWETHERRRLLPRLGELPDVDGFRAWAAARCQGHMSNVTHPLFPYLRDEATFAELREFILQETPFDIHFGDLIALMLPGVHGRAKAEFGSNFWDEVGQGDPAIAHRQLRLDMTEVLSIDPDIHLRDPARFCVEELELANIYFNGALNRALMPQAIGMMLATELMVPGRLDQQIQGWRRVGFEDGPMRYLIEHTVVDVRHAEGWLEEVVMPLLQQHPHLLPEVALGIERRLDCAGRVCDRMLDLLPKVRELSATDAPRAAAVPRTINGVRNPDVMIETLDLEKHWPGLERLLLIEDWPFIRADLEASEAQDRSIGLVARSGEAIRGFFTIHNFGDIAYLDLIVVEEARRNFFLAYELYRRAEAEMARRGLVARVAHCTRDSAPFLKQAGYAPGRKFVLLRRGPAGDPRSDRALPRLDAGVLDQLVELDARVFGMPRAAWIETLFRQPSTTFVGRNQGGRLKASLCLRERRNGSLCLDSCNALDFAALASLLDDVVVAHADKTLDCFASVDSDLHAHLTARGFESPEFFVPIGPLVEYRLGAAGDVGLGPHVRSLAWM